MKTDGIDIVEKKYNIKIIETYSNRYDEEFMICKDLDDGERFTIQLRPGEYIERTFKRVFGLI